MITDEPKNSNWKTVYATVKDRNGDDLRIGATIHKEDSGDDARITIHIVNGGIAGEILLGNLKDSKLTAGNLKAYFDSFAN